ALPWYQVAEGWFDTKFPKGQSHHTDVPTPHAYSGSDAPPAKALAVSASASLASGDPNHHLQIGYGEDFEEVFDLSYYGYRLHQVNFDIPAEELGATTRVTHRSVDDLDVATDWHAVNRVEIDYARDLDFSDVDQLTFTIYNSGLESATYVEIQNYPYDNPRLHIRSGVYVEEIAVTVEGNTIKAIVPFSSSFADVTVHLHSESQIIPVEGLEKVNSTGFFVDYESMDLDSAFLLITHPSLINASDNYTFYRESMGMDVLLVDIEELYQQYAAGIWKNPLAIRRFCDHLLQSWESPPSHLFLVGKSIHGMDVSGTSGARNDPEKYAQNLVPAWGWPTSDLPMTVGLGDTFTEAAIPTGRLAAKNQEEVLKYLNKVVEFEAQPAAEWMKNVMHFGGGGTENEQELFRYYLGQYEDIVEDTCFGGFTHSFYKTSTDPIQFNLSDSIDDLIGNGVSLMTFFGHASSTGFDQNIDSPSSYDNAGKYPLLIGNSCYTGNIHLASSQSTSEEFVLADQRGVIGFLAKPDLGVPAYLNMYTLNFYKQIFQKGYGQSVGQSMQGAVRDFQLDLDDLYRVNTALTFSLHGDPAITLNPQPHPDFVLDPQR
ncbi:MAG: hypothetical protein HKN32_07765, partial [Flavobacteriales bacterium]|nr:hypothetical protein [Flavobacteriales bacterium]